MNAKSMAGQTLEHLGGQRTLTMVGARTIAHDNTGALTLRIGDNARRVTHVRVTVSRDLYDVEFLRVRGATVKTLSEERGVEAAALREAFERGTGLATRL